MQLSLFEKSEPVGIKVLELLNGVDSYGLALQIAVVEKCNKFALFIEATKVKAKYLDFFNFKEVGGCRYAELCEFRFYEYTASIIEYDDGTIFFILSDKGHSESINFKFYTWNIDEQCDKGKMKHIVSFLVSSLYENITIINDFLNT